MAAAHRTVDAIVVGARCAGSATAAMLARAGRSVVVLDRDPVPGRHALDPRDVSQRLRRVPADRSVAADPQRAEPRAAAFRPDRRSTADIEVRERFEPVDGIDYGVSIPRNLLDVLLVEDAREQGAEVRERCSVERCSGARAARSASSTAIPTARGMNSRRHRRSARTAAARPSRRRSAPGARTGCPRTAAAWSSATWTTPSTSRWHAETMWQWRDGESIAFAFPNPERPGHRPVHGRRRTRSARRARTPRATGSESSASIPAPRRGSPARRGMTKMRIDGRRPAFWRASSGPGWVLAGDAAHFKDPVTGQGMGDALRMGTDARRGARAGPRRSRRDRQRDPPLGARDDDPLPARVPLRQRRHGRPPAAGRAQGGGPRLRP